MPQLLSQRDSTGLRFSGFTANTFEVLGRFEKSSGPEQKMTAADTSSSVHFLSFKSHPTGWKTKCWSSQIGWNNNMKRNTKNETNYGGHLLEFSSQIG